jgi:secondary thiamine-phosphate synthase enzyme
MPDVWVQRTFALTPRPRGIHLVTREVAQGVPDHTPWFRHTLEGPDDMPAHVKAVLVGPSLTLPIARGRLDLGTWQGVYLLEHRSEGGARSVTATLHGED